MDEREERLNNDQDAIDAFEILDDIEQKIKELRMIIDRLHCKHLNTTVTNRFVSGEVIQSEYCDYCGKKLF